MKRLVQTLFGVLVAPWLASAVWAADPPAQSFTFEPTVTGATAAAYCMAKHPYQLLDSQRAGLYTKDGYELVASPGVVGAVRRNFMLDRGTDQQDEGANQTCAKACTQFGKAWNMVGKSLRQKVGDGTVLIPSGLGDVGALVMNDQDFYLGGQTVGAVGSRGNTWQSSDVAQADYCCCHAVSQ